MQPHYRATLRLGLPIAIGQLGVIILGFADTTMVGRYGTDPLAAASFVNNLFTLVTFLLMGYSYGFTPIVSRLFGQGKHTEAGAELKTAVVADSLFGLLLMTAMGGLYFFLDKLGQPEALLPLARPYYLLILASMFFVMLFNVLRQFTDGIMQTKTGMFVLISGNALNILGNWLLIYGPGPLPELGLTGAGISTLAARAIMALMLAAIIGRRKFYAAYRRGFSRSTVSRRALLSLNAKSLPIAIQMGLETSAFTGSAVMAGWVSAEALAAYQVMVTIGTLGFLFYYSFGAATSIRVASFLGTSDWPNVRSSAVAGRNVLLLMAACSSLVIFCFAETLVYVFTTDTRVVAIALSLIPLLVLYQFADAMQICFANVLRATGHSLAMMRTAFISYLLLNLPAGYLLAFPLGLGVRGIFMAFSLGLLCAAFLFARDYHRVVRQHCQ
ncbi:MAG: MATE family efflux transporter [Bacteroidales bacterium]|nr:MATE family efflux transporter [Bacteroidales bacterium]